MATPKRRTVECSSRVACDGRLIPPTRTICGACREALARRAKKKEAPR